LSDYQQQPELLELDEDFIIQFVGKQPAWGPLGYVTYLRTYARDLDDEHLTVWPRHAELGRRHGLKRTEEFWLTITRVVEGAFGVLRAHCRSLRLPWDDARGQQMAQEMFRLIWEFKFTPPGRGLWMMGTPALARVGGGAANNCMFLSTQDIDTDFARPFCALMDFSMLGVGVGGDTRGAGKMVVRRPGTQNAWTYQVPDTREGWVQSLRFLLQAYASGGDIPRYDYSLVRKEGSPIYGFGGTASGPEPLARMLTDVDALLYKRIGETISSSDITDIFNMVGKCVVAGNVRRSAEIILGEPTDEAFLELKDKDKYQAELDSHRWASNNSVIVDVGQRYGKLARQTAKNGEPGYFWLDNARRYGRMIDPPDDKDHGVAGCNPCVEQSLWDAELCNLVETYPFAHASEREYLLTLKYAYLYAKIVTLIPTHDPRSNAVMLKNRRIGCSMSGIQQAIEKFGMRRFLQMADSGYRYIVELDKEYSDWLCVQASIKKTSVKPSGTVSLLCGATPGIHWPMSEYYWRVIRFATDSRMLSGLRAAGFRCVEIDPDKEPNTTAVYFPIKIEGFTRAEHEVTIWEQLELAAQVQAYWADNQVSVTVKFDKVLEGPQIKRALELYETRLKGVSFLPHDDHGYDHAPYQPITKETYAIERAKVQTPDFSYMQEMTDWNASTHEVTDAFCDGDKCVMPTRSETLVAT
jgi:ribonucleoside-triphosphate reductase